MQNIYALIYVCMSEKIEAAAYWSSDLMQDITVATATFDKGEFVGMVGNIAGSIASIAAVILTMLQSDEMHDAMSDLIDQHADD